MDDDFNTAGGLAALFTLVSSANTYLDKHAGQVVPELARDAAQTITELLGVLGIELQSQDKSDLPAELLDLAKQYASYDGNDIAEAAKFVLDARTSARAKKNWSLADAIRDALAELGLIVEDTAAGPRLTHKSAVKGKGGARG